MNHLNTVAVLFLLLYFTFLISPASLTLSMDNIEVADQLQQMRLEINQLNRKSGLLEVQNVRQDGEIRFLKTTLTNILNGNISVMQKRAARLLPLQLLMGREKETPIVGPPSGCKDLNQLGHTLNGIYLVKSKSKSISAVFCDFQPDSVAQKPPPPFVESRLGYVDVKSAESGIYFHVQIGNRSVPENGVLRYDHLTSNVGGGMNLKTGVFTAPKAGLYIFSFSIGKNGFSIDYLSIFLRLNGKPIGYSGTSTGFFVAWATLQPILKLKRGDRIDLWKMHGEIHQQCTVYCHHFSGSLLEENLIE